MLIAENPRLSTALPSRSTPAGSSTATVAARVIARPVAAIVPSKNASAQMSGSHGSSGATTRATKKPASTT